MRVKKSIKILIGTLFLALIGIGAWLYYKNKGGNPVSGLKPKVELGIGRISSFTDSTVDLTLNLLIDNPLPVGLAVQDFDYTVQMDGVTILDNRYTEPLRIGASDSSMVKLPSQLKVRKLKRVNRQAGPQEDSADYHFAGTFHFQEPVLGQDTLRISVNRRLLRYHLPGIEVVGYDMEDFGLSESQIMLHLRFTNNNSFPIEFRDPAYTVDLGSQDALASGGMDGDKTIPGESKKVYDVPLSVSMGELLKAAGQLIAEGKSLPFILHFSCQLQSENEIFKNSDVKLHIDGTLKDLETIKENIGG